jgi:hypothetical protein
MNNTYWNSNGKYQSQYIELSKLVPYSGKCEYVEGELIRSLCKVYYDYYNNGMCNNTSGACNYIRSKLEMPADVMNALIEIYHESNISFAAVFSKQGLDNAYKLLFLVDKVNRVDCARADMCGEFSKHAVTLVMPQMELLPNGQPAPIKGGDCRVNNLKD